MISSLTTFLTRQVRQIREGGTKELTRKVRLALPILIRSPLLLVELPVALLVVLAVRVIRPIVLVRFQRLINWRIGHFAGNTELYLCELDAGINKPKKKFVDIWYPVTSPCNRQLNKMWQRKLFIGPRNLSALVDRINALIPGGEVHKIGENTWFDRDVHNLFDRLPAHLTFLPEEEIKGQAGLRAIGIPPGASFICLIIRDSAYLNEQSTRSHNKVDWSYHDYRDCSVQNYMLAALALADRGYFVLRMGAVAKEKMNVTSSMIIDYATNGMRSDFMDVYLGAKCHFCISNGTGFDALPYVFRRPVVHVDQVPLGVFFTFSSRFLTITKKHWLTLERRFMTFPEIFDSGAAKFSHSEQFIRHGIELMESTPEEIAAVAIEMEERLKGTWISTAEDEELQRRFWEIYPRNQLHGEIRSRIGADFLRRHKAWLFDSKPEASVRIE